MKISFFSLSAPGFSIGPLGDLERRCCDLTHSNDCRVTWDTKCQGDTFHHITSTMTLVNSVPRFIVGKPES